MTDREARGGESELTDSHFNALLSESSLGASHVQAEIQAPGHPEIDNDAKE